jgi:hypothetical protein
MDSMGESVEEYWKRQKSLWLADLASLETSVKQWMTPVVQERAAIVEDKAFSTMEPDLGGYEAPGLALTLMMDPPQIVLLRPRGLRIVGVVETGGSRVVGANGRVDLECGIKREIVLRFRKDDMTVWYSFGGGKKRSFDEELFFELLARVADVRSSHDRGG